MRKTGVMAAVICVACLLIPFRGRRFSLGTAQNSQHLTLQEAIAAAQHNAKTGSSFTVLREIVANTDTRRVGDEAFNEAQTHHIEPFGDGILVDFLKSGGFVLGEAEPSTNDLIALHLVSLGPDGVPKDAQWGSDGVVNLDDAREVVKDTAQFTEELYSTSTSEGMSLERRFYGGSFPECSSDDCGMFGIPRSLLKLGADRDEYRQVVVLSSGLALSAFRYALSIPTFAANPLVAMQSSKWDALEAEFLRKNHMPAKFDFDPEDIRSKEELRERLDVLKRLDRFMEEALGKEANSALVKANLSVATIPLEVGAYTREGVVLYGSGTASLIVIYWQRLPTGGFAVYGISEAG